MRKYPKGFSVISVLLLIAVAGGGYLLYSNPSFREQLKPFINEAERFSVNLISGLGLEEIFKKLPVDFSKTFPEGKEVGSQPTSQKPKSGTSVSPTSGLTGKWSGTAKWKDNVPNPACSYNANVELNLRQNGSNLNGTWKFTSVNSTRLLKSVPCLPWEGTVLTIKGTVSGNLVNFSAGAGDPAEIKFRAQNISGLLQGDFESCPGQCLGGRIGIKGTFSGQKNR